MKVKNQGCIRRLSIKTVLAARKRNTIAVLAIALTALLFTSLFTIVLSINETNQGYQFRSVGTSSHGSFKEVTEDQIAFRPSQGEGNGNPEGHRPVYQRGL